MTDSARNGPRHRICSSELTYLPDHARNIELGFRVVACEWEENEGPNPEVAVIWRAFKFRWITSSVTVRKVA